MNWLYNTITRLILALTVWILIIGILLSYASNASAGEINYGSIKRIENGKLSIKYEGPGGESGFLCNLVGVCEAEDPNSTISKPQNLPIGVKRAESLPAQTGQDGGYALGELKIAVAGKSSSYYSLYEKVNGSYSFRSLLPFYEPTSLLRFTAGNSAIIFTTPTGKVGNYDMASGKLAVLQTTQKEFPFFSYSRDGKYISAYNYISKSHKIWNPSSGAVKDLAGSPSYIEFSNDESVYFADDESGYDNIYAANIKSDANAKRGVIAGQFTVADYLVAGNQLFYIANQDGPFLWNLYVFDPAANTKEKISSNISYGESLLKIGNKIAYGKIEGKNSNIAVYDPTSKTETVLRPIAASPESALVKKEIVKLNGKDSVLWSPTVDNGASKNLFVWLHGGPQRQTSLDYHPYLSYAVYDELLEKLAGSGSLVLKVDYTGSFGYGKSFIEALKGNVGKTDVADVIGAVSELKKTRSVGNVYLIGNSYGGYLSLRSLVESPSLFAGAISINGLPDWFSLAARIPSSPLLSLFYGAPGAYNIQNYLQANPLLKLTALTNQKILMIYGEEDNTVPTWQSKEFYSFAKLFGKNAEIVSYPDEDHVPKKRSTLNDLCSRVSASFSLNASCN